MLEIRADTGQDREAYVEAIKAADESEYSKLEELISNALRESLEKV